MAKLRPLSETKFINDANLVSYYKLEDTSDSKGGNTLTNNGTVTFNSALFGNGANYNGSNYLSSTAGITGSGARTISCWFYTTSIATNSALVGNGSTAATRNSFNLYLGDDGKYMILCYGDNLIQVGSISTSVWTNAVIVYDGSTTISLYVNGIFVASKSLSGALNTNSTFTIGKSAYEGLYSLNGTIIDDVAIFSRALSSAEVNELYQGMTLGEYISAGSSITKGLWHLNGSSVDSSGNSNNGTDSNITYSLANGKFGQGAGFNGSSSVISMGNVCNISGTAITISCWCYPTVLTDNTGYTMVAKDLPTGYNTSQYRLMFTNIVGSPSTFMISGGTAGTTHVLQSSFLPSINTWYNIIGTYDGANMKIYVNGKITGTLATTDAIVGTTQPLLIGQDGGGYFKFNGNIDEVRIDSRAWSAKEVADYYNNSGFFTPINRIKRKLSNIIAAVSNFFYAFFNQ